MKGGSYSSINIDCKIHNILKKKYSNGRLMCKQCKSDYYSTYYKTNKNIRQEKNRIWANNNKMSQKENAVKRKYNLSMDDYNKLLQLQNYSCAICKTDKPGGRGIFHIDHNHKTGKVRGLLCHGCNTGIGLLKESIDVLQNAITYLKLEDN